MSDRAFTAGQIQHVLSLPSITLQLDQLRRADALNADAIAALIAHAEDSVRDDPEAAGALAELCAAAGLQAGAPALAPRAHYVLAQSHAIRADFTRALALIDAARDGYLQHGQPGAALRTEVGRITALSELGRHAEAIAVARAALHTAAQIGTEAGVDAGLIARLNLNLGACLTEVGQADDALLALAAAEAAYLEDGADVGAGLVSNNRGVLLLSRGRAREALNAFEVAARHFEAAGETLDAAHALQNAGYAHVLLGHHSAGLAALQQASNQLHTLNASADQYIALLDLAEAYAGLNLHPEALSAYREADALLAQAGMTRERARALWGLGATLTAQSYFGEAERALRESAALFRTAGNWPALINVVLEQAALCHARGQQQQAIAAAQDALALIGARDLPLQAAQSHLRLAAWLAPQPAARAHLAEARALAEQLALPHLRQQVLTLTGQAALRAGDIDQATQALGEALALAERMRARLSQARMRTAFLADKTQAFDSLIALHARPGATRDDALRAYDISERARARTLIDHMSSAAVPAAAPGQDAPGQDASDDRIRALQVELNDCYGDLLAGEIEDEAGLAALQARALTLEQDIARLQLHSAAIDAASSTFGVPQSLPQVLAQLPPGATLLSYYTTPDDVYAFVIAGSPSAPELHLIRVCGTPLIADLLERLARQWARFEHDTHFVERHLAQLERTARSVLAELYDALVRPLAAQIMRTADEPARVIVVPHGLLHQIPFHALHDGAGYWIDQVELSYAPSATALALCQAQAAAPDPRALVIGVADARIPAVLDEAGTVTEALHQAETLLNDGAGRAQVLARAPGAGQIHVACHGLFRADNPMFSSLKLGDGWLTAADIARLDLTGARVTLSACESGRTQAAGGDEVLGLTHAFLSAGARSLLVSLWLVHDATTARLMNTYYRQLRAGASPAAALRAAQLAQKAQSAHPYYWAPFILVGQR